MQVMGLQKILLLYYFWLDLVHLQPLEHLLVHWQINLDGKK